MWLLIIMVGSGLFGAALQNYVRRMMTSDVPLETIYDEIGNGRKALRGGADGAMEALCGSMGLRQKDAEEPRRAGGFTALRPIAATAVPLRTSAAVSAGASAAVAAASEILLLSAEERAPLKRFFLEEMRVFLEDPKRRGQRLSNAERTKNAFAGLRRLIAAAAQPTVTDLEAICD